MIGHSAPRCPRRQADRPRKAEEPVCPVERQRQRGKQAQLAPQQRRLVGSGGVDIKACAVQQHRRILCRLLRSLADGVVGERRQMLDNTWLQPGRLDRHRHGNHDRLGKHRPQQRHVPDPVEQRHHRGPVHQQPWNASQRGEQVGCLHRDEQDVDRCRQPRPSRNPDMRIPVAGTAENESIDIDRGARTVGRQHRHIMAGLGQQHPEHATDRARSKNSDTHSHDHSSARIPPSSQLPQCSGHCELQALGRPIDLDRHAAAGGTRFDQLGRSVRTGVGKPSRVLPDDHRKDDQVHLVDEVVGSLRRAASAVDHRDSPCRWGRGAIASDRGRCGGT